MKEMIDKRFTKEELEDSLKFHIRVINDCVRDIKANKEKLQNSEYEEEKSDLLYYIESDSSTLAFHNVLAIGCQYVLGYSAEELHESYKYFAPGLSLPYPSIKFITPQAPSPAPIAVTKIFKTLTPCTKKSILLSSLFI